MTARNVQDEAKKAGLPWTAAKGTFFILFVVDGVGYDTFLPVSKFIKKDKIPDPHNVRLQLQVNGKVVQDDNTNLMLFKIPELLQAVSQVMTLRKGDVLLSTPHLLSPPLLEDLLMWCSGHTKGGWTNFRWRCHESQLFCWG